MARTKQTARGSFNRTPLKRSATMMDNGGMSGGGTSSGGGGDFLGGVGGTIQSMGILNALRTGDPRVDMVVAMCFPFALNYALESTNRIWNHIQSFFRYTPLGVGMHERRIVHKASAIQNNNEDTQNTILIKAIDMYLHANVKLDLPRSNVDLTATEDKKSSVSRNHQYRRFNNGNNGDDKTMAGALAKYQIIFRPPLNEWHDLGEFGKPADTVQLRIEQQETEGDNNNGNASQTVSTYILQSESGGAIDAFIEKAYGWYLDELRKLDDRARYLYELKSSDDDASSRVYTRYRLSEEKTFNSLFFKEKESLLKLVEHFQNRTGKYSIPGYPHKLGLLLSGMPGSGKTSFIKALAQHTGRSIVNVPLARISTNAELMSVFFDPRKYVEHEVPAKLGFEDVIFVMEDVDAASKVVKRRSRQTAAEDDGQSVGLSAESMPTPKSMWQMLLESNQQTCKDLVKELIKVSPRLKEAAERPQILTDIAQRVRAVPGLGLVGSAAAAGGDEPALEKCGADALSTVNQIMNDQSALDRYLSEQARTLKALIDQGTQVDDSFVDALLGTGDVSLPQSSPQVTEVPEDGADDDDSRGSLDLSKLVAQAIASPQAGGTITPTTASSNNNKSDNNSDTNNNKSSFSSWWDKPARDELNLSGLLNVLDGVVDSPGRIVIMTTNHVEHLDPALIRPGRIDKKLFLGHMGSEDAVSMLEHYFQQDLTEDQRTRVDAVLGGDGRRRALALTPAQIEQMTAEFDDLEDMIEALETKGRTFQNKKARKTV